MNEASSSQEDAKFAEQAKACLGGEIVSIPYGIMSQVCLIAYK